jgi:uncharacterized protein DUF3943
MIGLRNLAWLSVFTLAVLMGASVAANAKEIDESRHCSKSPCSKNHVVPLLRIAFLDTVMYGGLAVIWPEFFSSGSGSSTQLVRSWSSRPRYEGGSNPFVSDGDHWVINGIMHPLYGSEAYLAARDWKHTPFSSFFYSVFAIFTWEYLIEGWFQHPSAVDLVWTPVGGIILGELRYQLSSLARRKINKRGARNLVLILLDPLGQIEQAMFGCVPL